MGLRLALTLLAAADSAADICLDCHASPEICRLGSSIGGDGVTLHQ